MGIFIMLNNFFHDFAVALLFSTLIMLSFLWRRFQSHPSAPREFFQGLYDYLGRVLIGCWVWIVAGGAIRTWAYREYEWSDAAGRGQVAALAVKHILLVSLVIWGMILQRRLKKALAGPDGGGQ